MAPLKFSIITISYNHAEFIEDTIKSVLAQDYKNFEHIVIDGGSTDGSVEIFKRYPHLNWVSEPDQGISHALNKGLKKVTGDVVAWINSDDWYAPKIFDRVAQLAQTNDIIMGNAVETDRAGTPVRTLKNHPRDLYDLQKYWVPLAWLSQPSIFFSKKALETVKLPNGDYIDESYYYSMDFDLWLRFAKHFPFSCSVDEVFSYFRIYGENATGRTFASPQRELGRAFRNSMNSLIQQERQLTIIMPIQRLDAAIPPTISSIVEQNQKGYDILIVDGTTHPEEKRTLKETIQQVEEATTQLGLRIIRRNGARYDELIQAGIEDVRSPLFCVLQPGDEVKPNFVAQLLTTFSHDTYGACLFLNPGNPLFKEMVNADNELVVPNSLLSLRNSFLSFAGRTLVVKELGGYAQGTADMTSFRTFFLKMINKGWLVINDSDPQMARFAPDLIPDSLEEKLLAPFVRAALFSQAADSIANDIFYPIRAESSYTLLYPKDQVDSAKGFLRCAPQNWTSFDSDTTIEELKRCTEKFPYFTPAWEYLRKQFQKVGNTTDADACLEKLRQLRPDLKDF